MGHLIHPTGYRLGTSVKWKASWVQPSAKLYKKYLHSDLVIYHFINIFFRKYTTPAFTFTARRRMPESFAVKKKISGKYHILPNIFASSDFSFSHVQISRQHGLGLSCYFFDGEPEHARLHLFTGKRATHQSRYMFFPVSPIKKYQDKLIFLSEMDRKSKYAPRVHKFAGYLKPVFRKKWSYIFRRFAVFITKIRRKRRRLTSSFFSRVYNPRKRFIRYVRVYLSLDDRQKFERNRISWPLLRKVPRIRPKFLYQKDHRTYWNSPFILIGANSFRLLKALLVSFPIIKSQQKKKQLFFLLLLKNLLGGLLWLKQQRTRSGKHKLIKRR